MTDEVIEKRADIYANMKADEVANFQRESTIEDFIAGAHSRDEEVRNLEAQHKDDKSWIKSADTVIKFYKAFLEYLTDKAIGDKSRIIETITNNDFNSLVGYVKVKKSLNDMDELILEFETNDNEYKYKATWQPSDNYAVWQTCGIMGDDYSGYLLFPTYIDSEYFCVYYQC